MKQENKDKTKFHFQRFEFKYHIKDIQTALLLDKLLKSYMVLDPIVCSNNSYLVNSVYLDSPDWRCYYDNESGEKNRFKIRIRTYKHEPEEEDPVFLEIKRKSDAVVIKDRVKFPFHLYRRAFVDERNPFLLLKSKEVVGEKSVLKSALSLISRFSMKPVNVVWYDRIPLLGKYNNHFRITLDGNIKTGRGFLFNKDNFLPVFRHRSVMEVKFNGVLPRWFHEILKQEEFKKGKLSKYLYSVRMLKEYNYIN